MPSRSGVWVVSGVALLSAGAAACSVYDSELLEPRAEASIRVDTVQEPDAGRLEPDASAADASPGEPDGGGDTMTARPDVCGDGRVTGSELCDTGIDGEQPGACPPAVCEPLSECGLRVRRGEGCQAACVLLAEACVDDDRCCPSDCTGDNDNDCSQSCGDGEVQPEQETCEDGTDTPCPSQADCDDGEVCTEDVLIGSAENCNAECTNTAITTLVAGDGCCPEGANANNDPDCVPECGNAVREGDEECDSSPGCDDQCVVRETPQQLDCLERLANDECLRCACISCTQEVFNCLDSGDATRDMHCSVINQCARDNDCASTPCYCGSSLFCAAPNGPCVDEIHAASPAPDGFAVETERQNAQSAIGRADLLAVCEITNCSDVCP